MNTKNYYHVLDIKPSATILDIRLSYRKLAFKYHPDKNYGDPIAEASFKEINEAYQVLSDSSKRNEYNIKFFGNYFSNYSSQNAFFQEIRIEKILADALKLRNLVQATNPFRLNQDALVFQLENILSAENVAKLVSENNESINQQIISALLKCLKPLYFSYLTNLIPLIKQISGHDLETIKAINQLVELKRKEAFWKKYQIAIAILSAIVMCLIIYFVAEH